MNIPRDTEDSILPKSNWADLLQKKMELPFKKPDLLEI